LNPDGYRANISAWRQALSRLASEGRLTQHSADSSPLVLSVDNTLLRLLQNRQFGQPLALGTAIREAVAGKELIPVPDFIKSTHNIYQRPWSELPWSVIGWTLRQLGVSDPSRGEDTLPKGRYVVMENLEAAGREFGELVLDKTTIFDRVFTKKQFETMFASKLIPGQRLSASDLDILLTFLKREKGVIEYDGQTIRIKSSGENKPITEEDSAIASIKELIESLRHQVNLLNQRIDELATTAKSAVARKNRVAALGALKSKKLAESSLATRYASLNQVEEVAAKIEQAADQVQLVKVMESSTGVLKNLNAAVGGVDRVDGIVDQLREQMGNTDEVAAILAESSGVAVDESEIDEELRLMEAQENAKEDAARREKEDTERQANEAKEKAEQMMLDNLPTPPTEIGRQREKSETPTTETGIGSLSIAEDNSKEKEAYLVANP
jgi:charged multivesicular body protein 7